MNPNWSLLPSGALRSIFSHFSHQELRKIACVCKNWLELIEIQLNPEAFDFEEGDHLDIDHADFEEIVEDEASQNMDNEKVLVVEIPIEIVVEEKQPESEEAKRIRLLNSVKNVVRNLENRDPSTLTNEQKKKLESAKKSLEVLRSKGVFSEKEASIKPVINLGKFATHCSPESHILPFQILNGKVYHPRLWKRYFPIYRFKKS